ncbi:DUF1178 family protein [Parvularcula lutaonensis]|uniref:DUF1178 family protein n=1 Tax=Parvularcula lutaonensis TaxID=491923 RepID=A0ABV7MEG6_9PROT|nr:DUF1178 family protein [Parvularcula lutaonensis]GGY39668.1 hypothetical protein GCM10007148_04990 [Parvularcula lutaonensis]
MIKYSLRCAQDHRFEGWFSSSADFDRQKDEAMLECPACGTSDVSKALMAPAIVKGGVSASKAKNAIEAISQEWNEVARRAKDYVEKNFENVGKRFPEEARRIHYGETDPKPIFGEATPKEVKELKDEGVQVAPVPQPIPDAGETKKKLN